AVRDIRREVCVCSMPVVVWPMVRTGPFARDGSLCLVAFGDEFEGTARAMARRFGDFQEEERPGLGGIATRLEAYFAGELHAIDTIPADPQGTPFQRRVGAGLPGGPGGDAEGAPHLRRTRRAVRRVCAGGCGDC